VFVFLDTLNYYSAVANVTACVPSNFQDSGNEIATSIKTDQYAIFIKAFY